MCVNLSRYLAGNNAEDFLAELYQQAIECSIHLIVNALPCVFPQATAVSMSFENSGFFEAANIRDGLVVASWGLFLSMVTKSPESHTTVCVYILFARALVASYHDVRPFQLSSHEVRE
jgi:hypothetical protein